MCFLCQHIVYHLVCCSFFVNVRNLRLESHEFGKWTDSVIITLWNMHLYLNTCKVSSNGMHAMLFSICAICKQSILCGMFLYRSPKYQNCQGFCCILYLGLWYVKMFWNLKKLRINEIQTKSCTYMGSIYYYNYFPESCVQFEVYTCLPLVVLHDMPLEFSAWDKTTRMYYLAYVQWKKLLKLFSGWICHVILTFYIVFQL